MKAALKNGVDKGTLVQVKSSYKISADAKKKDAKPKKAVVKKAAAPKKKVCRWSCCIPCRIRIISLMTTPRQPLLLKRTTSDGHEEGKNF